MIFTITVNGQDSLQTYAAYMSATNVNYVMIDTGGGFEKHREFKSVASFMDYVMDNYELIDVVSFQFMSQPFLMVIYRDDI